MTREKQPSMSDAGEQLRLAMDQIDEMGKKIDALKAAFNENVKQINSTKVSTPVPPPDLTEAATASAEEARTIPAPPMVPRPVPGRYSMSQQPEERPLAPRVPRPNPRPTAPKPAISRPDPATSRRQSGRFYIQLDAKSAEETRKIKDEIVKLGRVVDSGTGTAMNPDACWIELAVQAESTKELIDQLRKNDLKEHVVKVIEVEPGEGRLHARQMDLFRAKMGR